MLEMNLCSQTALMAGMELDVSPHVAGVRLGMCVVMWMVFVREDVQQGIRGSSVTRVSTMHVHTNIHTNMKVTAFIIFLQYVLSVRKKNSIVVTRWLIY